MPPTGLRSACGAGCGVLASIVFSVLPAGATEPTGAIRLDETVVTGTKTVTERWDATVPTQVIPPERIEATSTIDLENVLGEIPGLYVRRNEQFGLGASTLRMQGADPDKVVVLLDGRRFRGGVDGVVDLRDIPANNVERIEIVRGPASSLYGSDAMAGVINIITRQGGPTPTLDAVAGLGSFGRHLGGLSHGWQATGVRYFLSLLHDDFRLFEQFGDVSAQFSGQNRDERQRRDHASLRLDWDAAADHRVIVSPTFQQQTNPASRNRNWTVGGEWQWDLGPRTHLTSWINRYSFDRRNTLTGFEEDVRFVDWEGESRFAVELAEARAWTSHRAILGVRARRQGLEQLASDLPGEGESPMALPPVHVSVWQLSPFVQSDVTFGERWSVALGSSFDLHERFGLDVNPRATVTYRPAWWSRVSATVGRGFRAPDLVQLFGIDVNAGGLYALLGNPDLAPETDLAFQLEAILRAPGLDAFLTLFRHRFADLIRFQLLTVCTAPGRPPGCVPDPAPFLPPSSLRFQTTNFARALTQGLELGAELSPFEVAGWPTAHQLRVGLGYAFLDTENRNGIPGEDGKALPFRPRHRVLPSLGWSHRAWGVGLRLWGEYEADAFTDVANSPDAIARNHWLWNFKLTLAPLRWLPETGHGGLDRLVTGGRDVAFFAQGENVFDREFGPVTGQGRLAGAAAYLFGVQARF